MGFNSDEAKAFGEYKTAIIGFLSGFAASKISTLWDLIIKTAAGTTPLIFKRAYVSRLLLFIGTFFMLAAQQYVVRQSSSGRLWTSRIVKPSDLLERSDDHLSVRTGATVNVAGAGNFEDISLDWAIAEASSKVLETLKINDGVLIIPADETLQGLNRRNPFCCGPPAGGTDRSLSTSSSS